MNGFYVQVFRRWHAGFFYWPLHFQQYPSFVFGGWAGVGRKAAFPFVTNNIFNIMYRLRKTTHKALNIHLLSCRLVLLRRVYRSCLNPAIPAGDIFCCKQALFRAWQILRMRCFISSTCFFPIVANSKIDSLCFVNCQPLIVIHDTFMRVTPRTIIRKNKGLAPCGNTGLFYASLSLSCSS